MGINNRLDLADDHRKAIVALIDQHLPDTTIWAFGSRVKWTSNPKSDLDLVAFASEAQRHQVGFLREEFEESDLPFRIDLLIWDQLSADFQDEIKNSCVVFNSSVCVSKNEGWQCVKFSEAVQINPKVTLERGVSYPFVDMASVSPELPWVNSRNYRVYKGSGSRFENGDVLMARITPCLENGKIARFRSNHESSFFAHGSTEFIVIRGRPEHTDTEFAYYLTQWNKVRKFAIDRMTGTSGRQRVPLDCFRHLYVQLPPIPVQRKIACVLSALDDKIELNRKMNETLEEMARALFKSWFVDFDPVRAKMQGKDTGLPKHIADLFPDRLVDSELGEIPEGWEVIAIEKEVEVFGGATPSTKNLSYWQGGEYNWATPKDLSHLESPILLNTSRKVTLEGLKRISSGLLPVGSVLLSSRAPIGYLAIAEVPTAINQGFIAMVCNRRLPEIFVLFWCHENLEYIKGISGGSTFSEISKRAFRPIPVLVPEEKLIALFETLVRPIFRSIVKNTVGSKSLTETRDYLLPMLISGELSIN